MKVYVITFNETVGVRVDDGSGSGDTNFSHKEVKPRTMRIMTEHQEVAVAYVKVYHRDDKDFTITSIHEETIDAVIGIDHGLGFTTR